MLNFNCSMVGQHIRGSTKEKALKLDELKAKRKAKDDKKPVCQPLPDFTIETKIICFIDQRQLTFPRSLLAVRYGHIRLRVGGWPDQQDGTRG
jgi:hypothetical protein